MHKFRKTALLTGITLVFLGIVGFILLLIDKATTGRGLDYYMNGWGITQNYLSTLILIAIVPIALAVAWGFRSWQKREENNLLRRYANSKSNKNA
jgi:uncharacterized membrane protein